MTAPKKKWKLVAMAVLAVPVLRWIGSGVGEFTHKISETSTKAAQAEKEIDGLKRDIATYTEDWGRSADQREMLLKKEFPDSIKPSEVMRYFIGDFVQKHPRADFDSIVPGSPVPSAIPVDPATPAVKVRAALFRIRGNLPDSLVLEYLNHIQGYPGAMTVHDLSLTVAPGAKDRLRIDFSLSLYVAPVEWLARPAPAAPARGVAAAAEAEGGAGGDWFHASRAERQKKPEKAPGSDGRKISSLRINKIIGGFAVINGEIYEVGDRIHGWKVSRIDQTRNAVVLKQGSQERTLVMR